MLPVVAALGFCGAGDGAIVLGGEGKAILHQADGLFVGEERKAGTVPMGPT